MFTPIHNLFSFTKEYLVQVEIQFNFGNNSCMFLERVVSQGNMAAIVSPISLATPKVHLLLEKIIIYSSVEN